MEHTQIYDEIHDFLVNNGFSEPTDDLPAFRIQISIPGRTMIINGRRMDEPNKNISFDITPLGVGSLMDSDGLEKPMEGFNMMDNDFWVESLDDFKYWFQVINSKIHII